MGFAAILRQGYAVYALGSQNPVKSHPHLTGDDLVLTCATNTLAGAEQVRDTSLYYPRFVRLAACR